MPDLPEITDAEMSTVQEYAQPYAASILRPGPRFASDEAPALLKEHRRRILALRKAGILAIVLPVRDDSDIAGIGIFDRDVDTVTAIMNDDPAVRAGVLGFDVHPAVGFPGDALPPADG